jgi:glycosyltransferase involved in cell wall biosynthesis
MSKINILHILQNSNIGGVQQQLLTILKAYDTDLMNPAVCCFKTKGEIGVQMEKSGFEVVDFHIERHYRFSPRIIRQLCTLMKERNIHIVRTHKYSASLYGRIAAQLARVPVVITSVHGNYRKDLRFERKIANKMLSRVTDRIVAVSESIRADIIKYDNIDPEKVLVIRNGVDTVLFSPPLNAGDIREELGLKANETVIGFVGRLVPAKGLQHLIGAFEIVRKDIGKVKLLIIGGGQLLEPLKVMARDKGLSNDIMFLGERTDIPQLLGVIDIFVMPSIAEGLPNALLEAMAAARPVIVTCAGGMGEIIQDGVNGLVVPVGDEASLSRGLRKLAQDRSLAQALGAAARQCIENKHSIRATARIWEDLYVSLLRKKGFSAPERAVRIV